MKAPREAALLNLVKPNQRFIEESYGELGIAWVRDFPELVRACLAQWDLTLTGRAEAGLAINAFFLLCNVVSRRVSLS